MSSGVRPQIADAFARVVATISAEVGFSTTALGSALLRTMPESDAIKAYALSGVLLGDELLHGPALLDGPAIAAIIGHALEHLGAALGLAQTVTPHPHDLAVARSVGQLASVLALLGATEDWGGLMLEA